MSLWQPTLSSNVIKIRPLAGDDWAALSAAASDPLIWELHPEPARWQPGVFATYFASALACQARWLSKTQGPTR